jgi:hypothetical protein
METHAEALFAAVDRDGSGLISFEEFQSWWLRRARATTVSPRTFNNPACFRVHN